MIDAAVAQQLPENASLDFKAAMYSSCDLEAEFPKDVAAMANSGGGVLVFGVRDGGDKADERCDPGDIGRDRIRKLESLVISGICPPVFNVEFLPLMEATPPCLVVLIPDSASGPHLVYRNEFFGASVRHGHKTTWLEEPVIERRYRARFDQQRNAHEVVDSVYDEAAAVCPRMERARFVGIARPVLPEVPTVRVNPDQAVVRASTHK
jgi:hypothetical protein